MQTLHAFIHTCTKKELAVLRSSLKAFKETDNKSLQLFDYLLHCTKAPSRQEASVTIYNAKPDARITKLTTRLKEKVNYIIIGENFLEKSDRLDENMKRIIRVKRSSAAVTALSMMHGQSRDFTRELIEENLKDSTRINLHIDTIQMLRYKRMHLAFTLNMKEYEKINEQIRFFLKCYEIDEKMPVYFYEIINGYNLPGKESRDKKIRFLETTINQLQSESKYITSHSSIYYFYLFRIEYHQLKNDFHTAKKVLLELGQFIKSSTLPQATYLPRHYNEIGYCEVHLGNYQKAISYFEKSKQFFTQNHKPNYYKTLDIEFYPRFYSGQWSEAERIADELLQHSAPLHGDFQLSKYNYFKANVLYKTGEYKKALQILNAPLLLNKDKTGYDIAVRTLRIQCLLAMNRIDEASNQVEVLRRHADRYKGKDYLSERDGMIIQVLRLMDKRGFNGTLSSGEKELVKKLGTASGDLKWQPMTPELVKFHEWYEEFSATRKPVS